MAITAQDINNQSFAIARKGYDIDEVDVFLERVADEIDEMNAEIARLKSELDDAKNNVIEVDTVVEEDEELQEDAEDKAIDKVIEDIDSTEYASIIAEKDAIIADLNEQLADKQANDSAISQALIIAQRSADEIIVKANAQASETMQDAREEADRILSRANADKQDVVDSIRRLEDDKEAARMGYADLLRNLIDDANHKLIDLGYDDDIANIPGVGVDSGQVSVVYNQQISAEFIPAEATDVITASPVFEKDLSGFGDVSDDFEDVE